MNISNHLRSPGHVAMAVVICFSSVGQADILYQLEPGSTITPISNGSPSGPSEALTGTFSWVLINVQPTFVVFDATSLTFQSASFLLTLNTTVNDLATSVFPATHTSFFSEIVDGAGPGIQAIPLSLQGVAAGTFDGPFDSPTTLFYSGLGLAPKDGGNFVAQISFEAIQVPEPSVYAFTLMPLILLVGRRLRR